MDLSRHIEKLEALLEESEKRKISAEKEQKCIVDERENIRRQLSKAKKQLEAAHISNQEQVKKISVLDSQVCKHQRFSSV